MYSVILSLLHLVISSFYHFRKSWNFLAGKISSLLYARLPDSTYDQDAEALQRVPAHMGAVISEDEVSYKDLAIIVLWAFQLGIGNVSVFHSRGELPYFVLSDN